MLLVVILMTTACFYFNGAQIIDDSRMTRDGTNWTYNGKRDKKLGMKKWYQKYPDCGGKEQSPINIQVKRTVLNKRLELIYHNYNEPLQHTVLENNGHTVQMTVSGEQRPSISGAALQNNEYRFEQLHFHWGMSNKGGSEHLIDGRRYAIELHLVHYNAQYKSFKDALNHADGLAVLGVFYDISRNNPGLQLLLAQAEEVQNHAQSTNVRTPITLRALLPRNLKPFFRYRGSLTTPPCSQIVTWILYKHSASISTQQARVFRKKRGSQVHSSGVYKFIGNNHRLTQPLNGRTVEVSSNS